MLWFRHKIGANIRVRGVETGRPHCYTSAPALSRSIARESLQWAVQRQSANPKNRIKTCENSKYGED